jgi:parallel beta-helix repeat protein
MWMRFRRANNIAVGRFASQVVEMISSKCLASGFLLVTGMISLNPLTASALSSHEPISIFSNADFTPQNGVTGGTGTSSDPFVIDGWKIAASGNSDLEQSWAIWIMNVTSFFTIRNIHIDLAGLDGAGVQIRNSTNGVLTSSKISNCQVGIFVSYSNNITVKENTLTESVEKGFLFLSTDSIRFYHNNVLCDPGDIGVTNRNTYLDDGYPSGGNYWRCGISHMVDDFKGPLQDQPGRDGIADSSFSYSRGWYSYDSYPLMRPFGTSGDESYLLMAGLILVVVAATSIAIIVMRKRRKR